MKPILFTAGPFHVFSFGLFLSLAFILSSFIVYRLGKDSFMDEEDLMDIYVKTSLVALLFARVFYIIFHFNEFTINILKYIIVRESPGLSLFGALGGGAVYLYFSTRNKKNGIWKVADIFSLSFCFAYVLINIGEFLGGASYGKLTKLQWGVNVIGLAGKRHPVELYTAIFFSLLFILLLILRSKLTRYKLERVTTYIFLWGLGISVFLLEFIKESSLYLYKWINLNQIVALILVVAVSVPLIRRIKAAVTDGRLKKI